MAWTFLHRPILFTMLAGALSSKMVFAQEPRFFYQYQDRSHGSAENLRHLGGIYLLSWAAYPLALPKAFREEGSWKKYRHNFGKIEFDHDGPFWNWAIHPLSGSQLFLYYRANGYSRMSSLGMSFLSSALFELTVEIYTEPASLQDLYQTPVLGACLGLGLENLSLYLLNSGQTWAKVVGHILNPATLFWFYEGKTQVVPQIRPQKRAASLTFVTEF